MFEPKFPLPVGPEGQTGLSVDSHHESVALLGVRLQVDQERVVDETVRENLKWNPYNFFVAEGWLKKLSSMKAQVSAGIKVLRGLRYCEKSGLLVLAMAAVGGQRPSGTGRPHWSRRTVTPDAHERRRTLVTSTWLTQ